MEFNINGYVWVKLTPNGVEAYNRHYADLGLGPAPLHFDGLEAWARFQMWELMLIFGAHSYNGSEPMFENSIVRFRPPM